MEGDAGTSRLNPTGPEPDASDESDARSEESLDPLAEDVAEGGLSDHVDHPEALDGEIPPRRDERFGRGWLVAICACLILLTAGVAVGGFLALRSHDQSEAIAREDAVALERAKDCVSATQAPDVAAMTASQTKIIECATGDFAVQANLFTSMLVEAYQAANVAVQVSDMRGAVEKHNDDGSVDVLVAMRVKVTNSQAADQEQGYRLRVNMAPADGTYKVNRLDQVTS
jgi:Mce-associated membrane protein